MSETLKNEIEFFSPHILLNYKRIDICAKLLFLKYPHIDYFENLYKQQLFCSTAGTFIEFDNPLKRSFNDFKQVFFEINETISNKSFDWYTSPIVIDQNNNLVNGAHRLASAVYNNEPVGAIKTVADAPIQDLYFFKKNGLNSSYIESMLSELFRSTKFSRLGVIWGLNNYQKSRVLDILPDVIWEKDIGLNERGKLNITEVIYQNEPWVRNEKNKSGIYYKSMECFKYSDSATFFIIDDRGHNLTEIKESIRKDIGIGKHAIHICDDHIDSVRIFEMVNNKNSLHMLNNAKTDFWPSLNRKLEKQFNSTSISDQLNDEVLIDGTACLELYGLREANDVDLLTTFEDSNYVNVRSNKDNFHTKKWDELIHNPSNFLIYNRKKFISLENLRRFKMSRREIKDKADIKLINAILSKPDSTFEPAQLLRRQWYKHKATLIKLLQKLGIYEQLRKKLLGR